MTDYRDRLEMELRRAAARSAPARSRSRSRVPSLVPALGLVATAIVMIAVWPRGGVDPERPVPAPAARPFLLGTYSAPGESRQLRINRDSMRMIGGEPGTSTLLVGFISVSGNQVTVRVDPTRTTADQWPGPLCSRGRVDDAGVYRFRREADAVTFEEVEDPCRGRVRFLTGGRWRRVGE